LVGVYGTAAVVLNDKLDLMLFCFHCRKDMLLSCLPSEPLTACPKDHSGTYFVHLLLSNQKWIHLETKPWNCKTKYYLFFIYLTIGLNLALPKGPQWDLFYISCFEIKNGFTWKQSLGILPWWISFLLCYRSQIYQVLWGADLSRYYPQTESL
jgi:hypothetical protein